MAEGRRRAVVADRIAGLVIGVAVGDAVGLATEFMSKREADAAYRGVLEGRAVGGEEEPYLRYADFVRDDHRSKWSTGEFTDDTSACALLLRLMVSGSDPGCLAEPTPEGFAAALRRWQRSGFTELGETSGRGMGLTIAKVVDDERFLSSPRAVAGRTWNEGGRTAAANGAVMRTAPVALLALDGTVERAVSVAEAVGAATHADPRSGAACRAVTCAAALLLRADGGLDRLDVDALCAQAQAAGERALVTEAELGEPPPQRWPCPDCTFENAADAPSCEMCTRKRPKQSEDLRYNAGFGVAWDAAAHAAARYDQARAVAELREAVACTALEGLSLDDPKRMGYCFKAVACAFWALRTVCAAARSGIDPQRATRRALMSITMAAGDADTNGAVAGALLGAAVGRSGLPRDWVEELKHVAWLTDLASQVIRKVTPEC